MVRFASLTRMLVALFLCRVQLFILLCALVLLSPCAVLSSQLRLLRRIASWIWGNNYIHPNLSGRYVSLYRASAQGCCYVVLHTILRPAAFRCSARGLVLRSLHPLYIHLQAKPGCKWGVWGEGGEASGSPHSYTAKPHLW